MPGQPIEKIRELFLAACKVPLEQRNAFLVEACGQNTELLTEVESLLVEHDRGVELPGDSPTLGDDATKKPAQPAKATVTDTPTQVGRYRIIGRLGQGGMGTVYQAEQREPIKRSVAVKVIKAGVDTAEVIARFESERQALAMMDHPNIARVLDAGADDRGRPYFVMEYVPGIGIIKFADENKLPVRERLDLFIQICDAIAHAHSKAIIHRDIKSSNVLAYFTDGKAMVKVIDFGIAKAVTGGRLTDHTFFTEQGRAIGTYEAMSPEQANASPDIDTRTDVYALGVLLYELLTGSAPFSQHMLGHAADAEIRRIIREVDPPRPSTRLSGMGNAGTTIAAARRLQLAALTRQLRTELEWIPLKALRKERDRRYASPMQMADDIRNYIGGRPLIAAPDSKTYRLKKFVRRNKRSVAAVTIVFIAILIAAVGLDLGRRQANSARKKEAKALEDTSAARLVVQQQNQEIERKVAEAHVRAATLAEQRGNWSAAYDEYRAAESAHFPDRLIVAVGELRSLDRMSRPKDANELIAYVQSLFPDVAQSPKFKVVEGFFFWSSKPADSVQDIHEALARSDQLSDGDRAFAEALVTDDIKTAAAKLREAVRDDRFNRDAWVLLSIADLLLGDARLSEQDAAVLQGLYPGDDAAAVVAALAAAFQNRRTDANAYLDRDLNIPADLKSALLEALGLIAQLRSVDDFETLGAYSVVQLYTHFSAARSNILGSRPLPIPKTFSRIEEGLSLFNLIKGPRYVLVHGLDIFPNAVGEYIAGMETGPADTKAAIAHLEKAIAMPSLIECRRAAAVGIAIYRWSASAIHKGPEAERIAAAQGDLDRVISLGGIRPEKQVGETLILTAGYQCNLYAQTRTLALTWLARVPDDPQALYFLAWADSKYGERDLAVALYKRALAGNLPGDLAIEAKNQIGKLTAAIATQPATAP